MYADVLFGLHIILVLVIFAEDLVKMIDVVLVEVFMLKSSTTSVNGISRVLWRKSPSVCSVFT